MTHQPDAAASATPHLPHPIVSRPHPPRWFIELTAVTAVVLAGILPPFPGEAPNLSVPVIAINLAAGLTLLGRRRWPLATLAVIVILSIITAPLNLTSGGPALAAAIAVYAAIPGFTRRGGLFLAWGVAIVEVIATWGAGSIAPQAGLIVLLGGALGESTRSQRAEVAAITDRAERAEQTRDALARERVAQDRLAIARDLHDVVAHQITIINLHAGVAASAVDSRPSEAHESLAVIKQASQTALREIGDLMNTLRDPHAVDAGPPGLSHLDDVVAQFSVDGLRVQITTSGQPRALPGNVDVTAIRVITEALRNAFKHGTGTAVVLISYLPNALQIEVTNPVISHDTEAPGTRQGLVGMEERVDSVRGTLEVTSEEHTWRVVARLPSVSEG